MKSLLYICIIIGLVSAIVGIFVTFSERNKAITAKQTAEAQLGEAIKQQKSAEDARNAAVKTKEEAEKQFQSLKDSAEQAMAEAAKVNGQLKDALAEKDKILDAEKQAEAQLEKANAELKLTETKLVSAEQKKQNAEARYQAELADKELAQKNLENEKKLREETEADFRRLANVMKGPESIAYFCSDVMSAVLSAVQAGDIHYASACDNWRIARDREQKTAALEFFSKAKTYYNVALTNIEKLVNVDKDTVRIKSYLKKVTEDDITSTDSMTTLLNRLLDNENEVTLDEKANQSKQAANKKSSADNGTIEICGMILNLMDNNKDAFTKTQRDNVESIKKDIEQRVKSATAAGAGDPLGHPVGDMKH